MSHLRQEPLSQTVGSLLGEELECREPGTVSKNVGRAAVDTDPWRVDWNFLIVLPKIYRAVLKDATLLAPGSCRH